MESPVSPASPALTPDQRLALLAEATETLHGGLDPSVVVPAILDLSRRLIAADAYAVWRYLGPGRDWQIVADHNLSPGYSRRTAPTGETLPLEPLVFEDVLAHPLLRSRWDALRGEGIRSLLVVPLKVRGQFAGTITFYYRTPHARDETELRIAIALASLAGSALTTAELYQEQMAARAASEAARQRLEFLAEASALLSSSLDYEATLAHLARLTVPRLADWCTVHVAAVDGPVRQVVVAHADPAKVAWAEEIGKRYPEDPARPDGIRQVIRSGVPELYPEITDEMLGAAARDPEHLELLRRLGMTSVMIVPLRSREQIFGALTFITAESGTRYGDEDLRLAEDLARRAGLAIDNARLYREARQALAAGEVSAAAFRSSEEQFRHLVEQSPLSVQILSPEGRTLEVNRAWEALWGARAADLAAYNILEDRQLEELGIMPYIRRAFAGESVALPPVAYDRKRTLPELVTDDQPRWVRAYAYPVRDGSGAIRKVVLIHEDFTERKRLEDQLRERVEELALADRQKDEFLAMLAHELRNPLAPMLNATHVLRDPGTAVAIRDRSLGIIDRQVRHMARLLDDLLDVSRITRGIAELRKEPTDVRNAVESAAQAAAPLLESRGHRFHLDLPPRPAFVLADPARLEQVVINLLNNAAKYTPLGGRIEVAVAGEGEGAAATVVLRVRDNGEGIPAELLPRIFELFVQGSRSPDRGQGGLGIGLTLVRDLVRMHDGTVEARSEGPGRGSEFVVRLPAYAGGGPDASRGPRRGGPRIEPRHLLVVDDNEDAAESLKTLLEAWGHRVSVAHRGNEVMALYRRERPEVVLLDIGLPGMDGYEVAEQLAGESANGGARPLLVAVTGYGRDEDRDRTRAAGFDHHLTKPVDPDQLRALLDRVPRTGG